MAYSVTNFKTKKEFLAAVKHWAEGGGPKVMAFQPGGIFPLRQGANTIEGPHFPKPHRWYASVKIVDDVIVEAK